MNWKIVLIDDEEFYTNALEKYLEKGLELGTEIVCLSDEYKAIDYIQNQIHSISVLVIDYKMPGLNGIEFINTIEKFNGKFQIIILTGRVDVQLASLIPSLNIFDLLEKDLHPREIVKFIQKAHEFFIHQMNKANRIKVLSNKLKISNNTDFSNELVFSSLSSGIISFFKSKL